MGLFFLFVDGVGIGSFGPHNPLTKKWSFLNELKKLPDKRVLCTQIDPVLGVDGLPQSGSGQTALFTGVNVAANLGRHFGPYPHSTFKKIIEEKGLFKQWMEKGRRAEFINAFPERFLEWCKEKNRWATISYMVRASGLTLNSIEEVRKGNALTAEITQRVWKDRFYSDLTVITPQQAAQRAINRLESTDLLLMEFYLTDKAGHEQSKDKAKEVLTLLNDFLLEILVSLDLNKNTLLITSDHGNLEDLSVKTHTMNPVPLIAIGKHSHHFGGATSILDITPRILTLPTD